MIETCRAFFMFITFEMFIIFEQAYYFERKTQNKPFQPLKIFNGTFVPQIGENALNDL